MQIALRGNDEDMVGADHEALAGQLDQHRRVVGKDFVQQRRLSEMSDEDDSDAQVVGQAPLKPDIGVEPARRPAHANDRKIVRRRQRVFGAGHSKRKVHIPVPRL
jgi:hypothetical protein